MSEENAAPRRHRLLLQVAELGASAQAAIPGLYAWAITVAPAAWSRGAPLVAKAAAVVGLVALVTAPFVEGAGRFGAAATTTESPDPDASPPSQRPRARSRLDRLGPVRAWTGPQWARVWSVWGFVLSSAIVWALAPAALSSARLDGVRGSLGMVGWALFAFASAGPTLRPDPTASERIVAGTPLKPRSELPRGDGLYVVIGVAAALAMQGIGWGVPSPERAVLVRLVTIVCGIAVLGGFTSIALSRHLTRTPASRGVKIRRSLIWFVLLLAVGAVGAVLALGR
jgi:hypothetical protein